jgi:carboxylesterase type B
MTANGGRNDRLFHAAAAESQSFAAVLNVTESQFMYDGLVNRTGCNKTTNSTLSCLRSLNASTLQAQNFNTPFPGAPGPPIFMYNPTLDGDLLRDLTISSFANGAYIRVPSIFGDVTNEGTLFPPRNISTAAESSDFLKSQFPALTTEQLSKISSLYPPRDTSTAAESSDFLKSQFPALTTEQLSKISSLYPPTTPRYSLSGPYWRQASHAYGDLRYTCPGLFLSSTLASDNLTSAHNWNYRYNVLDPVQVSRGLGVPHESDVFAIWGPENTSGRAPESLNNSNRNIIPVIQGYWTSFIRFFDPNTSRMPGSPTWEVFTSQGQERLLFQTNRTRMENVGETQKERCDYFRSIAVSIQQ